MKPHEIKSYANQLRALSLRLDSEIGEISNEIATGGLAVGEHDMHVRESPDANIAIGRNEESIQRDVRAALQRIESGTFGKCADCNKTIGKARLDVLPYTPVCIACETIREAM